MSCTINNGPIDFEWFINILKLPDMLAQLSLIFILSTFKRFLMIRKSFFENWQSHANIIFYLYSFWLIKNVKFFLSAKRTLSFDRREGPYTNNGPIVLNCSFTSTYVFTYVFKRRFYNNI